MSVTTKSIPGETLQEWQELVDLAVRLSGVRVGLVMRVVDDDIEVVVASNVRENPYHPGDREHLRDSGLYCETVVKTGDMLLVPDALASETWKHNPDIKLGMVCYLGFAISWPNGRRFGTICILDDKENQLSDDVVKLVEKMRDLIENQLALHDALAEKNLLVGELQEALDNVKTLSGLLPICSGCKNVRNDRGYWERIESYLHRHTDASFSHGLCPDCLHRLYPDYAEELAAEP